MSGYLKKLGLVGLFWGVGSGEESGPRQGPEREGGRVGRVGGSGRA